MKVYCLNLDRSRDRLAQMTEQFQRIGHRFVRIPAVDAAAPEVRGDYLLRCEPDMSGQRISLGAFACFESHRKAWRAILADGEHNGIVVEDDLIIARDFGCYLEQDWFPPDTDIVRLETYRTRVHIARQAQATVGSRTLHTLRSRHVGAACYAITAGLAQSLLLETETISDPVDELLFNPESRLFNRFRIRQMFPAPAIQADRLSTGELPSWAFSTIGKRHEGPDVAVRGESLSARLARRVLQEVRSLRTATRYVVVPFG